MFGEVSAALTSVKAMTEIAKGLNSVKQAAEINLKTVELTGVIIEVQQRLLAINEEMDRLHARIKEFEAQAAENKRLEAYDRIELPNTGVIVYAPNEEKPGETSYYACQVCLERDRRVSTLQKEKGDYYLRCKTCNSIFQHTLFPEE